MQNEKINLDYCETFRNIAIQNEINSNNGQV